MGIIVALVGGFGASLGFAGAMTALFTGGIGFSAGADDAGAFTARAVGALFASFVGVAGAFIARSRLRIGVCLLMISAASGLIFVFWFYLTGAVMLLAATIIALWSRPRSNRD